MLGGSGIYPRLVGNALRKIFGDFPIVFERSNRLQMVRRRAAHLGYIATASQILFVSTVYWPLRRFSRDRIREICNTYLISDSPVTGNVRYVRSVNDDDTIRMLREVQPEVVAVFGTRVLSKHLLSSVPARFINLHGGVSPGFRGCHGAYWALATGHPELAGVTIHLIDQGLDTGPVLKQARIPIGSLDNFSTYTYLQVGIGLPLYIKAIEEILDGRVVVSPLPGFDSVPSQLYYHPTLWSYLANLKRGIR